MPVLTDFAFLTLFQVCSFVYSRNDQDQINKLSGCDELLKINKRRELKRKERGIKTRGERFARN